MDKPQIGDTVVVHAKVKNEYSDGTLVCVLPNGVMFHILPKWVEAVIPRELQAGYWAHYGNDTLMIKTIFESDGQRWAVVTKFGSIHPFCLLLNS